jgi:transposase
MSQSQLDLEDDLGLPKHAVAVNRRVWFQDQNGIRAVFVDQTPFYCYPLTDPIEHRFCALQLVEAGLAKVNQVCHAFDIQQRTLSRLRKKFRRHGIAGLVPQKKGRKSKQTPSLAAAIVELYYQGKSTYDIGTQLGLSPSTVQRILKDQGVKLRSPYDRQKSLPITTENNQAQGNLPRDAEVAEPQVAEPQVAERQVAERQVAERQTTTQTLLIEPQVESLPVEATSIPYASPLDRFFVSMGMIEEAPVEYQSTDGVPYAGVLLGLAVLEETHLLEEARNVYGRLQNGWYGLRSLIWSLVSMALLRIKRPEQLKHYDPAGVGCVLGLPRAAEVKTIRRKLTEIARRGKAAEWHRRLARRRAEQQPESLAILYVDGHVRAYHGKHRIGKAHVSRLKRHMKAELDYWVHQADGQPLLVVHESTDLSFREMLRDHVLPEIRQLAGDRRVRVVFDRGGWSRELFEDLLRANFDFTTYRKGPYEPLADSEFTETTLPVSGQPDVHYELAEGQFDQEGWPLLRLIAVKKRNGGQTQMVATGQATWESLGQAVLEEEQLPAEVAWSIFRRWIQENWFKYMREEFALDVLLEYSVDLDDADRLVVNPRYRELNQQLTSLRKGLKNAQAKYTQLVLKAEAKASGKQSEKSSLEKSLTEDESKTKPDCRANCSCLSCRCRNQLHEVRRLSAEYARVREERGGTTEKIRLGEASDRDGSKLSYEKKLFTDTIKLSAYEIETHLYGMLSGVLRNREGEGRGLIKEIFGTSGDLRVGSGVLEVHLDQLSAPRYTSALQSLCSSLNAQSRRLPETDLVLRFFVKPRPTGE